MVESHEQRLVEIGTLTGADYNPREMPAKEMDKLKRSLQEFGFVQPIIARVEDGLVIGGHQRLAAIQALLTEQGKSAAEIAKYKIPAVMLENVSEERTKALNLALNKISGDWDYTKLAGLLEELSDIEEIDLTGFSNAEVDDIVGLIVTDLDELDPLLDANGEEEDIDDLIAGEALRFVFKVKDPTEASLCKLILEKFGMSGPHNSTQAFVDTLKAANATLEEQEDDGE